MDAEEPFAVWFARVRSGDAEAATELVRHYERPIRFAVRVRLTDPRLRRQFDATDICQTVLANFFVRAAAGQFDLQNSQQLVALLVKMAQNQLLMEVRKHRQQRRDVAREVGDSDAGPLVADRAPSPFRHVAARDLLQALYDRLRTDERDLAERRAHGQTWVEIAHALGEEPQALRMRLSRAIDRVAPQLGLDPDGKVLDDSVS